MQAQLLALLGRAVALLALQIVVIAILAWLAIRFISALQRRFELRLERVEADAGRRARLRTLLSTAVHTMQVIVVIISLLMILYLLGINITPVLAGVSVVGLAVSLGAQALIRDFIGGLLILIENQYRVGDVIQVAATSGTVEQITLRATYLRDDEGKLWIVPNGEVRVVSNSTRDWSRAVVDLNVPASADMDRVQVALEAAMKQAWEDEAAGGNLLEAPAIQAWNSLTDTAVQIRLTAKTAPGRQWAVARTLRQKALGALQRALDESETSGKD